MSLIVCAKTGEGLVVGADNLITIHGSVGGATGVLNTYEHSKKIIHLDDLPVAIAFWGIGHIGKRSVRSFVLEFEKYLFEKYLKNKNKDNYNIQEITASIYEFMKEKYDKNFTATQKPLLGFLVTGFTPGEFFGEIFAFHLPIDKGPVLLREKEQFGMHWFGVTDSIIRFYKGFDPKIMSILKNEFNFSKEQINKLNKILSREIEYKIIFDSMPIQEAIDLTHELIELTITRNRFTFGAPAVGGNIDIAVITPEDKFHWINKEEWKITERGK